jgi:hypothetical protein
MIEHDADVRGAVQLLVQPAYALIVATKVYWRRIIVNANWRKFPRA